VRQVLVDHLSSRGVVPAKPTLDTLIKQLTDQEIDLLIYEILRFDPMGPLAFRTALPNASIGGVNVDPKTVVCLVIAAAMLDGDVFPDPEAISFNRPPASYLHFGTGLHKCAGQMIVSPIAFPIAMPLLREMFRAIASLPKLRRAAGVAGTRQQALPPLSDGLTVRFDSAAAKVR
jgi:cytochrome P450